MFLKRMFAPIRNSFYARRRAEHDAAVEARLILSRVKELVESSLVYPVGPAVFKSDAAKGDQPGVGGQQRT